MAEARQVITAIIYDRRGRKISEGRNHYTKSHPFQARLAREAGLHHKIYLHAEIEALIRLRDWSRAHRIVVERYAKSGAPALAKPCPVCQRALRLAGIKHVEHT